MKDQVRRNWLLGMMAMAALAGAGCEVKPKLPGVKGQELARIEVTGVQVYIWDAETMKWRGTGPVATFKGTDDKGEAISGRHSAGPMWTASDGSMVKGERMYDVMVKDAGTIPMQMIRAVDHTGDGVFSGVTLIRRTDTHGGMPPAEAGKVEGQEARVPYTAVFEFYGAGAREE